ncbi:MAG: hypothetical protein Q9217_000102 [Psora testacea]
MFDAVVQFLRNCIRNWYFPAEFSFSTTLLIIRFVMQYLVALLTSLIALAFGLGLLGRRFITLRNENVEPKCVQKFNSPEACKKILACTGYGNSHGHNLLTAVQSRAFPNQRLVRAFGISNGFTTDNEENSKAFRKAAYEKINKVDDAEWKRIGGFAELLVTRAIQKADDYSANAINIIPLDVLVQSVTLKISLYVLYGVDPLELDNHVIEELASDITTLWVKSKDARLGTDDFDKARLKHNVSSLLPNINLQHPMDNPLNFILPAYETMWRAVFFGLIEVVFKSTPTSRWVGKLQDYLAKPSKKCFEEVGEDGPSIVSVSHIVNEILRCYPPTKRVYRKLHMTDKTEPEIVAADIEACHLDQTTWGEDASGFRPDRWKNIHPEAQAAFMPFGGSPFVCPAKQDFGPRMIGLLIASFAAQVQREEWFLGIDEGPCSDRWNEITAETHLATARGAYELIAIFRKSVRED